MSRVRPGSFLELALFFVGVLIGFGAPLQRASTSLSGSARAAWGYLYGIAIIVMPVVFQLAQARQARRDVLYARTPGVLWGLVAGFLSGLVFYALCSFEALYEWLPGFPTVLAAACVIAAGGSRALWRREET